MELGRGGGRFDTKPRVGPGPGMLGPGAAIKEKEARGGTPGWGVCGGIHKRGCRAAVLVIADCC